MATASWQRLGLCLNIFEDLSLQAAAASRPREVSSDSMGGAGQPIPHPKVPSITPEIKGLYNKALLEGNSMVFISPDPKALFQFISGVH